MTKLRRNAVFLVCCLCRFFCLALTLIGSGPRAGTLVKSLINMIKKAGGNKHPFSPASAAPPKGCRMRPLLIMTSLSLLEMPGLPVCSLHFLYLSTQRLRSLFFPFICLFSSDVTFVALNKSVFPARCSRVSSWGRSLLSSACMNKKPPRDRFLQHPSFFCSADLTNNF